MAVRYASPVHFRLQAICEKSDADHGISFLLDHSNERIVLASSFVVLLICSQRFRKRYTSGPCHT